MIILLLLVLVFPVRQMAGVKRIKNAENAACSATAIGQGRWVTEAHCALEGMALEGKEIQWEKKDPVLDLASFSAPTGEVLKVAKAEPKLGEEVWLVGAPTGFPVISLRRVVIRKAGEFFDWGPRNMFDGAGGAGMSGGAIINSHGEVAGIIEGGHTFGSGAGVSVSQPVKVIREFLGLKP